MKLPSRFQIGDPVIAGQLIGGKPGTVTAVHFTLNKVAYDILFEDGKHRKLSGDRVHPYPDSGLPIKSSPDGGPDTKRFAALTLMVNVSA